MPPPPETDSADTIGIVIVDHGSRREESNAGLLEAIAHFRNVSSRRIVEPAHMELAEPSIATAFGRCVEQGARMVIVHPFFLLPGRHWRNDIPALSAQAAAKHPGVRFLVTAPLGLHPLMAQIMQDRIAGCLEHADGRRESCDLCRGSDACAWKPDP